MSKNRSAKKYSLRRFAWMVISSFFIVCCGLPALAVFFATTTTPTPSSLVSNSLASAPTLPKQASVVPTQAILATSIPVASSSSTSTDPPTAAPTKESAQPITFTPIDEAVAAAGGTYAVVRVNRLNVRSDPGGGGTIIGQITKGERVKLEVRVKDKSWAGFNYKGERGWISTANEVVELVGDDIVNVLLIDVATRPAVTRGPMSTLPPKAIAPTGAVPSGPQCPGFQYTCKQLTCDQAYACLRAGNRQLDGNKDGIPCNAQCG